MEAKIYLVPEDEAIVFEALDVYFKFIVSGKIQWIANVKCFPDGSFAFDCCFGEEYLDIPTIARELALDFQPEKYFVGRSQP